MSTNAGSVATPVVAPSAIAQSDAAISLAEKESAEKMHGMKELYNAMRQRPLIIKAYALHDTNCPSIDDDDDDNNNNNINDKNNNNDKRKNIKTVHFIRHGQGFHNLMADQYKMLGKEWTQFTNHENNPYTLPELLDPPLTEKGRLQAQALAQEQVASLAQAPELILLSPLCRAIQTGLIAFEPLIGQAAFVAHENIREESGVHICDKRRSVARQQAEFPQVDFSVLLEAAISSNNNNNGDNDDDPIYSDARRESKEEVGERIYNFMKWLSKRQERHIAIASHSIWLQTVFNGILECEDDGLKKWFLTGEMRSAVLEFMETRREEN
ncbi:hypothetical protein ACA910_000702 [Epithemia clementina (nom. ined.)]